MDALGILALGLLLSVTAVLLKDLGWRGAAVFSAFSLVALLSLCADGLLSLSGIWPRAFRSRRRHEAC